MKKYECSYCKIKQKIKEEQIVKTKHGIFGPCAKCRKVRVMLPLSKD